MVRANPDGSLVRVKDVARVELGAQSSDTFSRFNGAPAASLAIFLAPGANAVATANAVSAALDRLARRYPADMRHHIVLDSTTFVEATITEVLRTLAEAFVLVVLVVFLFLGSWRATLVPIIAVPVSLIGAFAVLFALGYSGQHHHAARACAGDRHCRRRRHRGGGKCGAHHGGGGLGASAEAARKAMREITGPIIAITLVLFVGVRSDRLHTRHHRRPLSPVRGGGVRRGDHFGDQRAHHQSGVMRFGCLRPGGRRGPHGLGAWRHRTGAGTLAMRASSDARSGLTRRLKPARRRAIRRQRRAFALFRLIPSGFLPEEDQGFFYAEHRSAAWSVGQSHRRADEPG